MLGLIRFRAVRHAYCNTRTVQPEARTMTKRAYVAILMAAAVAAGAPAAAEDARLAVVQADFGQYLADGHGRALYLFTADRQGGTETARRTGEPLWPTLVNGERGQQARSACVGECAQAWPPLVGDDVTSADDRVNGDQIGTLDREDDGPQVTYAGWPLYYFVRDTGVGDVSGQGIESFGGTWYLINPAGEPIQTIR
jgi:predicted lipoprotein with Yx(FWY)xxD motif